jgi:uncharacterized lipoprotein YajG
MKTTKYILLCLATILVASCSSNKQSTATRGTTPTINLALTKDAQVNRFANLDYGIKLNINDGRAYDKALRIVYKHDDYLTSTPTVNVYPEVLSFVNESMRRYMRTMGFNLDADVNTDYMLSVSLKEFNVNYLSGIGWSGIVTMEIEVYDKDRRLVYPNVSVVGRYSSKACNGKNYYGATDAMNKAYANALEDIDWDRIAFFLRRASSPALEGNKQVQGSGNTALEAQVIRWNVDSSPRGADVKWRVISSTPDVKNTMENWVGSTPYETTETLDIKGLTYNNSGDVQIEISCEKPGYIEQKKRFNLRQVIDQKDISTKFNLIKEE